MGRRTKQSIIEATLALLDEGDATFTYEALAVRAGVARQTLYTHFPDRAALLVAAVDHVRHELGADELAASVYEAPTARAALAALVEYHIAYTPQIMRPARAVEALRTSSPEVSAAFERRPMGRRQIARHVMTRLRAEGDLGGRWSVDDATDLVSALTGAAFTSELLVERGWSSGQLREVLHDTIERLLLEGRGTDTNPAPINDKGDQP